MSKALADTLLAIFGYRRVRGLRLHWSNDDCVSNQVYADLKGWGINGND